jgi:general secretion pathway protein G
MRTTSDHEPQGPRTKSRNPLASLASWRLSLSLARARRAERGLTLVELVIVITIIGVLTAAISIGVLQAQKRANLGAAKTACSTVRQATMQWKAVNPGGDCPTVAQLKQEKDLDTGFNLKDPWNNLYQLNCDSDEITCTSAGPDRKEGTEDDIHVPQIDTTEGK